MLWPIWCREEGRGTSFKVFNPLGMTRSLYILITLDISSFLSLAETSLQCWMDLAEFCSAGRTGQITAVLEGFMWQGVSGNLGKHSLNISFTHWFGATGPTSECPWGGEAPPLHLNSGTSSWFSSNSPQWAQCPKVLPEKRIKTHPGCQGAASLILLFFLIQY